MLAADIAACYRSLPQVEAVALAGSQTSGTADTNSDLDFYVYTQADLSLDERTRIVTARASRADINNRFWEPGDEWVEAASGIHIDVNSNNTTPL